MSGSTTSGSTNWQVNNRQFHLRGCEHCSSRIYSDTALFHIARRHECTLYDAQGVNAIYTPTATGFRIYLRNWNGATLDTAQANSKNWHVQWMGVI